MTLVVNVASQCGFTEDHYEQLVKLDNIYSYDGYFRVLAFPCNQFGEQEPGTIEDIIRFVVGTFKVEFPIFAKIDVIGEKADPAFKNLYREFREWFFHGFQMNSCIFRLLHLLEHQFCGDVCVCNLCVSVRENFTCAF